LKTFQPTFGVGEVWALEFLPPTAYLSKVTKTWAERKL